MTQKKRSIVSFLIFTLLCFVICISLGIWQTVRYTKKSKIINWSLRRRLFSLLANFLARQLLQLPITDFTNGYRIYSRRAVDKIILNCGKSGDGFIILSEILVEIYLNNFKIDEIESIFLNRKRGESSVNLNLIIESFIGLLKIYSKKKGK